MPATVTFYLIGVWFCVGLFVSLGWFVGERIVRAVLR